MSSGPADVHTSHNNPDIGLDDSNSENTSLRSAFISIRDESASSQFKSYEATASESNSSQEGQTTAADEKTVSMTGMAFNLANSTIGAGIVSLPFAIRESGYVLGTILLVVFGIMTNWSLQLLVQSAQLLNNSTSRTRSRYQDMPSDDPLDKISSERNSKHDIVEYEELAAEVCGKFGFVSISIFVLMINFGAATGYLVVMGDLAVPIMHTIGLSNTILANEYFLISLLAFVFVLPLSLLRNFSMLRYSSYVSIFGILFFSIAAIVFASKNGVATSTLIPAKFTMDIFLTAPIFIFSYACHTNLMNAYSELHDTLKPKMNRVVHGAVGIIFLSYLLVGQLGYITFGSATKHNILNNYPATDPLLTAARIGIVFTVILSYPMCSFPARHSIYLLILLVRNGFDNIRSDKPPHLINFCIIIPFFGISLAIALLFKDIVAVFGLTGSTASTAACFIAPPLIHMLVRRSVSGTPLLSRYNTLHWLLIAVGAVVGAISTVILILDIANPSIEDLVDMDELPPSVAPTIQSLL